MSSALEIKGKKKGNVQCRICMEIQEKRNVRRSVTPSSLKLGSRDVMHTKTRDQDLRSPIVMEA